MNSRWNRCSMYWNLSLVGCAFSVLHAQNIGPADGSTSPHPFAYVLRSSASIFSVSWLGNWSGSSPLLRYAHDHPGSYVVFSENGALRRLDTPACMRELEQAQLPLRELDAKQKALGQEQKPLEEQQKRLAAQQRAAESPQEQGRVGMVQGAIGGEQGVIGRLQGEIGKQQGEIGRALNERVQALIDACVRDGSCPRIATDTAQH